MPEQESFKGGRAASRLVKLAYPDGAHNAEAMAMHPATGDLYILTKEASFEDRRALVARLYMVKADALRAYVAGAVLPLSFVSAIDLPWLNYEYGLFGQIATSMDISSDGDRLLVLTYENVVEISMSKALAGGTRMWTEDVDYSILRLYGLVSQMEAISYLPDGKGFRLESEFNPDYGGYGISDL